MSKTKGIYNRIFAILIVCGAVVGIAYADVDASIKTGLATGLITMASNYIGNKGKGHNTNINEKVNE